MENELRFGTNIESLNRPAWTQYDLHAYRHRHVRPREDNGDCMLRDYFVKSHGLHGRV